MPEKLFPLSGKCGIHCKKIILSLKIIILSPKIYICNLKIIICNPKINFSKYIADFFHAAVVFFRSVACLLRLRAGKEKENLAARKNFSDKFVNLHP